MKFAAAFGAEVTVLSTSRRKVADAKRLGAHQFAVTTEPGAKRLADSFDLLIDTISAAHDLNPMLRLLRRDRAMTPSRRPAGRAGNRRHFADFPPPPADGLSDRRHRQTPEMVDFCGERGIFSDTEKIAICDFNAASDRAVKGDVRYHFVIDLETL